MCLACEAQFVKMAQSRAAIKAEWECSVCGPVKFDKQADPPRAPEHPLNGLANTIGFILIAGSILGLGYLFWGRSF